MEGAQAPKEHDAVARQAGRPLTVGWREWLGFPDWAIHRMKVKIDTGARTSALDVARYDLGIVDGERIAILHVVVDAHRPERIRVVQTPILGLVNVCNTSGGREERPLVETSIRLGPIIKRIRLTITDRSAMRFRMILGRKALENDFLVDVSQQYLLGRREKGGRRKAEG